MYFAELVYSNGEPIGSGDWVRVFVPRLGVWRHGIVRQVSYFTAGLFAVDCPQHETHGNHRDGLDSVW